MTAQQTFMKIIRQIESIELSKESEDMLEELKEFLLQRGYGYIPPNKLLVIPPNSIRAALKKAGKTYE